MLSIGVESMKRSAIRHGVGVALAIVVVFALGCGKSSDGPKPYPVKGTLKVNGEPAAGATIAFYTTQPFKKTIIPNAITEADGSFTLMTYAPGDGAPVGDYEVTVLWPTYRVGRYIGPDRLNKAYTNPMKSGLKAEVKADDNVLPPLELSGEFLPADPEGWKEKRKDR
jgi:hypothetical protein